MKTLILFLLTAALAIADEGAGKFLTIQIDTAATISAGASLQNRRTTSTSVQQEQWCLVGGTCDPTAVGGWTLGTDGGNRMVIQAGQGGSVLLDVLHVDTAGNLTVPGSLTSVGVTSGGTVVVTTGNLVTTTGLVRSSAAGGGFQVGTSTVIDGSLNLFGANATLTGSLQTLRSSSTSVNQEQWCFAGTCDPTVVGGWTLGTDSSNRMVIEAGQGGSVLLDVLHVDTVGNLTVPAVLSGAGLSLSGTATIGGTLVGNGAVRFTALTAGSGTLTPICIGSLNDLYTCASVSITGSGTAGTIPVFTGAGVLGNSDVTDSSGLVTVTGALNVTGQLAGGTISSTNGYQILGTTVIDGSQNGTFTGSVTAAGLSTSGTSSITSALNVTAAGGFVKSFAGYYEGSTQILDTSRDLINIANITASGTATISGLLTVGPNLYTAPLGTSFGQYSLLVYNTGTASSSYGMGVENYYLGFNSNGGYKFYQNGGSAPIMVIGGNSSLNVGIGTASPAYLLDVAGIGNFSGNVLSGGNVDAGGSLLANGLVGSVGGYQVNGTTVIDGSQNATFAGSLSANGIGSLGGMVAAGNITASAGFVKSFAGFYEGSVEVIDTSENLINIAALTMSGSATISGSVTAAGLSTSGTSSITSAGNITASGGYVKSFAGFYESGTQFLDTSRDLINIADITMSGLLTGSTMMINSAASNALYIPNGGISVGSGGGTFAGSVTLTAGSLSVSSGSFSVDLNISTSAGSFVARGSTGQTCTGTPSSSFASVAGIVTHC